MKNFLLIAIALLIWGWIGYVANQQLTEQNTMDHSIPTPDLVIEIPTEFTGAIETSPITVNNIAIDLEGTRLTIGSKIINTDLDKPADYFDQVTTDRISNYSGYKLIHIVPSLDTPVCTRQTKELEAAAKLFPNTPILIISNDTPFALQRFCSANGISNIHVFSDARTRQFGRSNGLFMPQYGLLARAIMIVDNELNVVYIDYAEEVTHELDLMNALAYLQQLTNSQE